MKTVISFIHVFIHLFKTCWCVAYPGTTQIPFFQTYTHRHTVNTKHNIHLMIPHKSLQHFPRREILHMPSDKMYALQKRLRRHFVPTLSALRGLDLTLNGLIATHAAWPDTKQTVARTSKGTSQRFSPIDWINKQTLEPRLRWGSGRRKGKKKRKEKHVKSKSCRRRPVNQT